MVASPFGVRCVMAGLLFTAGAACSVDRELSSECEFPTLAAGPEVHLALSCVEGIVYEGTDYFVGCAPVDQSRVGDLFLTDGGDTRFTGARGIIGLDRGDVFLLHAGTHRECDSDERLIAASNGFNRLEAGLLRVPLGAPNQEQLARKRAPWIVPGRYEVPQALKLDAVVDADGITVTNRNRYAWRNCQQIQINDDVEHVWETGDYLDRLEPGESHTWTLDAFGRDRNGLEDLSEDEMDEVRGKPLIIMCRAPRGRAFGRDNL